MINLLVCSIVINTMHCIFSQGICLAGLKKTKDKKLKNKGYKYTKLLQTDKESYRVDINIQ